MTYRFASFSLDRDRRQLTADGREIHLSPKAFDLLVRLIEGRSRALSKQALQEWLWPSTFVGEANLPTLVAEIRRALDDSAQSPAYLRTVHRFGYRFVAPVIEVPAASGAAGSAVMYLLGADRRFPLTEGSMEIGRAPDLAICIDSAGVSRRHARIIVRGAEAFVEDLGSKNGTFVGGQPLAGLHRLRNGDEIRVGPVPLTFRIAPPAQATDTMG